MPDFSYSMSLSMVMLHPTTGAPIMETGREAKVKIATSAFAKKTVEQGEEFFLAMMHDAAVRLWETEVRPLWFPSERTPQTTSRPSSNG